MCTATSIDQRAPATATRCHLGEIDGPSHVKATGTFPFREIPQLVRATVLQGAGGRTRCALARYAT